MDRGATADDRVASAVDLRSAAEFAALELRILEAEASTWRFLQAVPSPLVVVNADNVIELINAQTTVQFGYQPDELIGQPIERLFPAGVHATPNRPHNAGGEAADEPGPLTPGPLTTDRPTTGSSIMGVHKDGHTVEFQVNLSAITLATGPAMLASICDVSQRKLSEEELRISDERFRVSFDWAPIGMGLIDLRPATLGHFLRVNAALCRLTGYCEADLLATSSMAITHPADRAETATNLQRLVDGGAARWDTDKRFVSNSGQDVWVHFTVTVVHDAGGSPSYGVSQVEDITDRKLAQAQLQERFYALANNVDVGFMMRQLDPPEFVYFNPAYLRMFGYDPAGPPPTPTQAMASIHPDDLDRVSTVLASAAQGRRVEQEWRFTRLDGQLRWASGRVSPVVDQDGQIRLVAGVFTDITDRKNAAAVLAESQEQFRELVDNVDVGFSIRDAADSRYLYLNPRFLTIFGFDPAADWPTIEEVIARRHPGSDAQSAASVADVAPTARTSAEWRLVLPDGTKRWIRASTFPVLDNEGHTRRVVGIIEDITERKDAEAALAESQYLRHTALHDGLTGLPNRALLMDRLDSALARSERTQREVTVFFCDLDGFKRVNDIAGHAAGDQVLLEITHRLRSVLRDGDTVARIGGDEFVILVEPWNRHGEEPADPVADRAAAIRIAERIGAAVRQPITINGVEHGVSVSIGVTHVGHPPAGHTRMTTSEEILQDADTAMYRAKSGGKDRFAIFEHGMRADVAERGRVERILRQALRRPGEADPTDHGAAQAVQAARPLVAAYQPIFDGASGALVGFEALARLADAHGRNIPPDVFIPIAEDSGLIRTLGNRMLDLACGQLATWRTCRPELGALTMAVNISALQAQHGSLADDVHVALRKHGLLPVDLVLELTETVLLDADQSTIKTLQGMHDEGIGIAIDDFGTGYASLRYLATLPISVLKIDRSFTAGLPDNKVCRNIINAVAGLAADLDLTCVVEGVETQAQRDALPIGVQLQGYLIGRPQRPDQVDLTSLAANGSGAAAMASTS